MSSVPGRIVAVDFGRRRVGIAQSDPLRLFARPVGTFAPADALARLQELYAAGELGEVVLGWPLEEDGNEGPAVAAVRRFLARIEAALPGVPVTRVDERFSSEEAKARLYASGRWKEARGDKGQVDAEAACVLLEDYLQEN